MSERTPWWKSFLGIRKTTGPKDASQTFEPDFDPFAPKSARTAKEPDAKASTQKQPGKTESSRSTSEVSEDTYDDSRMESVFNEQTCRRNMRVSRSGRFKEKRKVRSSLPIEEQDNIAR